MAFRTDIQHSGQHVVENVCSVDRAIKLAGGRKVHGMKTMCVNLFLKYGRPSHLAPPKDTLDECSSANSEEEDFDQSCE